MIQPLLLAVVVFFPVVALDLLLGRDIPGFSALAGLSSCIAVVVVSKGLGKLWLQRGEDYYEEGGR